MQNSSLVLLTLSLMTRQNPEMKTSTLLQGLSQLLRKLRGSLWSGTQKSALSKKSARMRSWINSYTSFVTQQIVWSGVFDTLLPAAGKIGGETMCSFSVGTWNARSFFCRDQTLFGNKLKYLHKQIKLFNVFCMQEVRGSEALVKKHFRLIERTHWIFCNFPVGK